MLELINLENKFQSTLSTLNLRWSELFDEIYLNKRKVSADIIVDRNDYKKMTASMRLIYHRPFRWPKKVGRRERYDYSRIRTIMSF